MFHAVMKAITILFGLLYVFALGLYGIVRLNMFSQEQADLSLLILEPLGLPWSDWFRLQLDVFGAPFVNLIILVLITKLARRRKRG
ncbi:hypothetical protein [Sphingomicrobium astaxanthinifaciens]|uniref:hypothetical protein n=1 Tax=Sphingomicrobium astaxanthinifaciens TaxID=1227949 RepID=UPI001FCB2D4E|nr:hypothetical protein [Sphingomicrobium astaxanthinifaciens]MCJ7420858.1 hypothetical protein [Sphingomicrobium astaxanthinifaciens]